MNRDRILWVILSRFTWFATGNPASQGWRTFLKNPKDLDDLTQPVVLVCIPVVSLLAGVLFDQRLLSPEEVVELG